jgi:5-methylcytosine-specific restriction endonuclease McrA
MRREFSNWAKAQVALRANGRCERCTARLTGRYNYDHIIPDALGGEPTVENCQLLCKACHSEKTTKTDVPRIAKTKRQGRKHAGIKKPRSIRAWRKFDGTPVYAERER